MSDTDTDTKWNGVGAFSLSTADGSHKATIYASGLQMTPVYVYMSPLTGPSSDPASLNVNDAIIEQAYQNTTLIDYETGAPLIRVESIDYDNPVPGDGWYFCTKPNNYVTSGIERTDTEGPHSMTLTFYVACKYSTTQRKTIGASVLLSDTGELIVDTDHSPDGFNSNVVITAYEVPYSNSLTMESASLTQFVNIDASTINHSGQYADDGSSIESGAYNGLSLNNLWRQNNFIIRPLRKNGTIAKIKEVHLYNSEGKEIKIEDSGYHIYSDSTYNGFNTQCYIFDVDPEGKRSDGMPASILGNFPITLSQVSWTEAVCITWLTQYDPINCWSSEKTAPVSVVLVDSEAISYFFTPIIPGGSSYNSIKNIVSKSAGDPSMLFYWGSKTANAPSQIPPIKFKYSYLYAINRKQYLRYDNDHHHYVLNPKTGGSYPDHPKWFFEASPSTGLYRMFVRNNESRFPMTKLKGQTDWLTIQGDIDIYTKTYMEKWGYYGEILTVMLSPIWNASSGNEFQILSDADGYPGWTRCDDGDPPKFRLAINPNRTATKFSLLSAD